MRASRFVANYSASTALSHKFHTMLTLYVGCSAIPTVPTACATVGWRWHPLTHKPGVQQGAGLLMSSLGGFSLPPLFIYSSRVLCIWSQRKAVSWEVSSMPDRTHSHREHGYDITRRSQTADSCQTKRCQINQSFVVKYFLCFSNGEKYS